MTRFLMFASIFLLLCFVTLAAGTCQDQLAFCSRFSAACGGNLFFTQNCPKTCNTCSSNPCSVNKGGCKQICNNTGGVAVCSCEFGYRLGSDKKDCIDIDECMEGPNPCNFPNLPAFCVNLPGTYTCQPQKCSSHDPETINYYKSGECCRLRNSSCGITEGVYKLLNPLATSARVFGGVNAATSSWPWMAQLLFRGRQHCGGTLISNRWVVSAAHCFTGYSFTEMAVYLGDIRSAQLTFRVVTQRVRRDIKGIILHEHHNGLYENDIALVELEEPVAFNAFVSPICLPCGETPRVGDKCWVTGFGMTDTEGAASILQEVDVPIVGIGECRKAYQYHYNINEGGMMCAGYSQGVKDACTGDSGGPLACQRADSCDWYLSGVTSFGRGCAQKGFYGVYVNVINFEDWIRTNVGNDADDLCSKQYNICKGRVNRDVDCYTKLDRCNEYPSYMETNCNLGCCQQRYNEVPDCFDALPSFACKIYSAACHHPLHKSFMTTNCKKFCNFC